LTDPPGPGDASRTLTLTGRPDCREGKQKEVRPIIGACPKAFAQKPLTYTARGAALAAGLPTTPIPGGYPPSWVVEPHDQGLDPSRSALGFLTRDFLLRVSPRGANRLAVVGANRVAPAGFEPSGCAVFPTSSRDADAPAFPESRPGCRSLFRATEEGAPGTRYRGQATRYSNAVERTPI